jgi:BirA family transcriptional regulator, biotin operon repressor / biotin---[acetyl-CoA-carboxylase] ligase
MSAPVAARLPTAEAVALPAVAATDSAPPPPELVRGLIDGPAFLTGFEWHEEIDSTNRRAADLAAAGRPEGHAVAADVQTAGRGRHGRPWTAPAGTSLMVSFILRPDAPLDIRPLLPLLAGVALAEVVERHVPGPPVALKWPNDLLVAGRKAAGILVEEHAGAVVVGIGLNTDWRGIDRPADLAGAMSLAEATGTPVDRWRVFAGLVGVLGNRYGAWRTEPRAFLPDYRDRCATIGRLVRVERMGEALEGSAEAVVDSGALRVRRADGSTVDVTAGDVTHLRDA